MRIATAAFCLVLCVTGASAQTPPSTTPNPSSPHSDGQTVLPQEMTKEKDSPNGRSGPANTGSGGAPAESPQGQTPPAMQAAPEGSSKTIVDPK